MYRIVKCVPLENQETEFFETRQDAWWEIVLLMRLRPDLRFFIEPITKEEAEKLKNENSNEAIELEGQQNLFIMKRTK